jgi:hypothetical protein
MQALKKAAYPENDNLRRTPMHGDARGRDGGVREELAAGVGWSLINAHFFEVSFFEVS